MATPVRSCVLPLELQPAIGACAVDEWRRGAARRARQLLAGEIERDRREAFALERVAPVTVE